MNCVAELADISMTYEQGERSVRPALKSINLKIYAGECIALCGAPGSGKSTLLQITAGLLKANAGHVKLGSRDLSVSKLSRAQICQEIAMVFQFPESQIFEETVANEVAFGLRNLGTPEDKIPGKITNALLQVGLEPDRLLNAPPLSLSSGEMRRVALASVLAIESRTVLLDEPFSGLDPRGRYVLGQTLRALNQQGRTLIIATHDIDDVFEIADRALILSEGRLIYDGNFLHLFRDTEYLKDSKPTVIEISDRLRSCGFDIPGDIRSMAELANAINSILRPL